MKWQWTVLCGAFLPLFSFSNTWGTENGEKLSAEEEAEMRAIQQSLFGRARRYNYESGPYLWSAYYHVDFGSGYGSFTPIEEGTEETYNLMAQSIEEIALSEEDVSADTGEKAVIRVKPSFISEILILATLEMRDRQPLHIRLNSNNYICKPDLIECIESYNASHGLVAYEQLDRHLLEQVDSFPEGQLLISEMYKTKQLPLIYCNYKQYKWSRCFADSLVK